MLENITSVALTVLMVFTETSNDYFSSRDVLVLALLDLALSVETIVVVTVEPDYIGASNRVMFPAERTCESFPFQALVSAHYK